MITEQGWEICNIDSVVIAERPKLKPHIESMRDRLAAVLRIDPTQIGVKATTNDDYEAIDPATFPPACSAADRAAASRS